MSEHLSLDLVQAYETLEGSRRQEVLRHAAACAPCRTQLLQSHPSAAFAFLSLAPLAIDRLDALSTRVERAVAPRFSSRPAAALVLAASLLLGVGLGLQLWNRPDAAEASVLTQIRDDVERLLDARTPIDGVELISSPGEAQVIDLAVGDTKVIMIFDEAMDI